jgi:hypothetical protein
MFLKMTTFWAAAAQQRLKQIIFHLHSRNAGGLFLQFKRKNQTSL